MDITIWLMLIGATAYACMALEQRRRIAVLARFLRPYALEKLMEDLTSGYLRAAGEDDPQRSTPIWRMLQATEETLGSQLARLAKDIGHMDGTQARVSTLALPVPLKARIFPSATFDLRTAVAIHAQGFDRVARNALGLSRKEQAFMLTAELFLFQHTCHWYCRSKAVASARLQARHQSSYRQVLQAASPGTRQAYDKLVGH